MTTTQHNKKPIKESQRTFETVASAHRFLSGWNKNDSYTHYEFNSCITFATLDARSLGQDGLGILHTPQCGFRALG